MEMENGEWATTFLTILRFSIPFSDPPMGKGDKRTKKGKIYRGSYGKRRPGKKKNAAKKAAPAKR